MQDSVQITRFTKKTGHLESVILWFAGRVNDGRPKRKEDDRPGHFSWIFTRTFVAHSILH